MYFNRVEAKLAAKMSMRQDRPRYLVAMVIYVLLTTGVSYLLTSFMGNGIADQFMLYIQQGYDPMEVLTYFLQQNSNKMAVFGGVQFVLGIYTMLVSFGLTSYTLRLARNENPGYNHLLDGFLKAGRLLWMELLISIIVLGWYLVMFVPLIGIAILLGDSGFMMPILLAFVVAALFALVVIVLRYVLAKYFLLDDPDCTAREAITRSKRAMKGRRWEFLMLEFSFMGWALLISLVSGLAAFIWAPLGTIVTAVCSLWYTPYVMVTEANFYDCVTGSLLGERSSGDYAGPTYDYRPPEGPEPF